MRPHRRLFSLIVVTVAAFMSSWAAKPDSAYTAAIDKARMYVTNDQWANATALYMQIVDKYHDDPRDYAMVMIAMYMTGDTTAVTYLERAAAYLVKPEDIFDQVRAESFALGRPDIYERMLTDARAEYPWLARIVDRELLSYYDFRNDGPRIVRYASIMLDGLPESVYYRRQLARGYMLCGDTSRAVRLWEDILTAEPDNYDTLLDLANYYVSVDKLDRALPYLIRAYELRPTPYVRALVDRAGKNLPLRHD